MLTTQVQPVFKTNGAVEKPPVVLDFSVRV